MCTELLFIGFDIHLLGDFDNKYEENSEFDEVFEYWGFWREHDMYIRWSCAKKIVAYYVIRCKPNLLPK
jgi:hypothetical protein